MLNRRYTNEQSAAAAMVSIARIILGNGTNWYQSVVNISATFKQQLNSSLHLFFESIRDPLGGGLETRSVCSR